MLGVLRRIGSRVPLHDLEVISDRNLRHELTLVDGDEVELLIKGEWRAREEEGTA